jgi:hypothetical protein
MIGEGDCGAIGGMKIGRGNRNTQRKPAPVPLSSPQIPLDQTRERSINIFAKSETCMNIFVALHRQHATIYFSW